MNDETEIDSWDDGAPISQPGDLDDYLDYVAQHGYALTASDRLLCLLRGIMFGLFAALAGVISRAFYALSQGSYSSVAAFLSIGWVTALFSILLILITVTLALNGVRQILSAITGHESVATVKARDGLLH